MFKYSFLKVIITLGLVMSCSSNMNDDDSAFLRESVKDLIIKINDHSDTNSADDLELEIPEIDLEGITGVRVVFSNEFIHESNDILKLDLSENQIMSLDLSSGNRRFDITGNLKTIQDSDIIELKTLVAYLIVDFMSIGYQSNCIVHQCRLYQ